jgi:hypothetical protein
MSAASPNPAAQQTPPQRVAHRNPGRATLRHPHAGQHNQHRRHRHHSLANTLHTLTTGSAFHANLSAPAAVLSNPRPARSRSASPQSKRTRPSGRIPSVIAHITRELLVASVIPVVVRQPSRVRRNNRPSQHRQSNTSKQQIANHLHRQDPFTTPAAHSSARSGLFASISKLDAIHCEKLRSNRKGSALNTLTQFLAHKPSQPAAPLKAER